MMGLYMPKFMFNTHFDDEIEDNSNKDAHRNEQEIEKEVEPTFSLQELEDQKAIEYKRGLQEGKAQMLTGIEKETANILDIISSKVITLNERHKEWADTINKDAIKLTRVIVKKLAPRMMKEWDFHEIEDAITEAFKFLSNEPRVLIRVSERAHEPIETEITRITSNAGFQGKIQVIGDRLINNGDCSISWDAGSLEKSLEETWSTIDKIIDNVMAGETNRKTTSNDRSYKAN
jgi:flagellar assembly protein FliH